VAQLEKHLEETSNPPEFPQPEQLKQWRRDQEKKTRELLARIKTPGDLIHTLAFARRLQESFPQPQGFPQPGDGNPSLMNPILERLLPLLHSGLKGEDPLVRAAAATQIGAILDPHLNGAPLAPRFKVLLPVLIEQLEHRNAVVRSTAARTVARFPLEATTVNALVELLGKEPEASVAGTVAQLLGEKLVQEVNPVPGNIQGGFPGDPPGKEAPAPDAQSGPILAALGKGTEHTSPDVRKVCQQQLKQIAKAFQGWADNLQQFQQGQMRGQRLPPEIMEQQNKSKEALDRALPTLQKQVPAVMRGLKDENVAAAVAAHEALEAFGDLRGKIRSGKAKAPAPKPNEKEKPATFGENLRDALPALKRNLKHTDLRLRLAVLYALESLDEDGEPAVGDVIAALNDENLFIRWGSARVLANLAPRAGKEAVPVLADLLQDPDADVRGSAVLALKHHGPQAAKATAKLAEVVKKGDLEMRLDAIQALQAIGPEARSAAPALIEALSAKEKEVRQRAAEALGQIAPADEKAREALSKALLDPDADVRQAASLALLPVPVEKQPEKGN